MRTKLPSAIVYNWYKVGEFHLTNELYRSEGLVEKVIVYSLGDCADYDDYSLKSNILKYLPDTVIFLDNTNLSDAELADKVLVESQISICSNKTPKFSIFTPVYHTGERIYRTYNSIKNQTLDDWEWVIIDDSKDDTTWAILENIARKDNRVKPHRIYPISGGNIGLVKKRAASLCIGDWLVELDHDDELFKDCLSECYLASLEFPDSEFLYSDYCAKNENGTFVQYDDDTSGHWYARPGNRYVFAYAGNVFEEHHGEKILRHYHCDMNPLTIRFNIGMPNHVRVWKSEFYHRIGGHNIEIPVADDFELIIRTFLYTKFTHIRKPLYIQWHSGNSTVDNNSIDINRRSRVIRDIYDVRIHNRILELGFEDWNWDYVSESSIRKTLNMYSKQYYFGSENILNYLYK